MILSPILTPTRTILCLLAIYYYTAQNYINFIIYANKKLKTFLILYLSNNLIYCNFAALSIANIHISNILKI